MNKNEFLKELEKQLSYSEEKCIIINEILENHFFLSNKNKNKILDEIIEKLNISYEEAEKIYNTALIIVKNEIKNKLKHPFKSQDER